jgi:hypothetical protein
VLVPLWHHAERAKVPAAKSVPVRVVRNEAAPEEPPAPADMISGTLLTDAGRDIAKGVDVVAKLALRKVAEQPLRAVLVAAAAGFAIGGISRALRRRRHR